MKLNVNYVAEYIQPFIYAECIVKWIAKKKSIFFTARKLSRQFETIKPGLVYPGFVQKLKINVFNIQNYFSNSENFLC